MAINTPWVVTCLPLYKYSIALKLSTNPLFLLASTNGIAFDRVILQNMIHLSVGKYFTLTYPPYRGSITPTA